MALLNDSRLPRGIRNNNPGNLRRSKDPWQGLAKTQDDPEFFQFDEAIYGIRAIARTLITYQDKKYKAKDGSPIDTIEEAIERWAPAIENNVAAYVKQVDADHPKTAWDILDFHNFADLFPLVVGIIEHENGLKSYKQNYTEAQITKALILAGDEPAKLPKHPAMQAAAVTAASAVSMAADEAIRNVPAQIIPVLDPIRETLLALLPYLDFAKWLLLAVILISAIAIIWTIINRQNKGLI